MLYANTEDYVKKKCIKKNTKIIINKYGRKRDEM